MKPLKIVGLQRSGTNYLEHLLRANVSEPVCHQNEPWWKHALPLDGLFVPGAPSHWSELDCVRVILVSKSPDSWLLSLGRDPQDQYRRRPGLRDDWEARLRFYAEFHWSWLAKDATHIRYEDLLRDVNSILHLPAQFREDDRCDQRALGQRVDC